MVWGQRGVSRESGRGGMDELKWNRKEKMSIQGKSVVAPYMVMASLYRSMF